MHAAKMLNREYRNALSDATRLALSISRSGRAARLILELASGQNGSNSGFNFSLTHEEVASMLGTTRETVIRVPSEFKRKQIIMIKEKKVTSCRIDALELLAQ